MKIYIETIGCKANQAESACIYSDFTQNGYEIAQDMTTADVIVINTCTVTNRTDYKCRYAIKKALSLKNKNPHIKVIVTGCYSQLNHIDGVDLVIDNNHKDKISQKSPFPLGKGGILLYPQRGHGLAMPQTPPTLNDNDICHATTFTEMTLHTMPSRNRAYVKIQDGCDMSCAYCTVPLARGKSRSRDFGRTLDQVKLLLQNGYQDIVLTGINLGLYRDTDGRDLVDLLYALNEFDALKLIRLSSIEPQLFTDRLFTAIKDITKIASHFHIPLQSGCDSILKKHDRHYTAKQFLHIVDTLHSLRDNCSLSFDVIAGLPGETDRHFIQTYDMLNKTDFTYLHTFIFSPRKGTPAFDMPEKVHGGEAKTRSQYLIALSRIKKKAYLQKLLHNEQSMLVACETVGDEPACPESSRWCGLTDRGIHAYFRCEPHAGKPHHLYLVKPVKLYKDGVNCKVGE